VGDAESLFQKISCSRNCKLYIERLIYIPFSTHRIHSRNQRDVQHTFRTLQSCFFFNYMKIKKSNSIIDLFVYCTRTLFNNVYYRSVQSVSQKQRIKSVLYRKYEQIRVLLVFVLNEIVHSVSFEFRVLVCLFFEISMSLKI
jgi:hypothetical protein